MNRTARAALTVPIAAMAMSGVFVIACRGGPTVDGFDGSWGDGEATHQSTSSSTCEKAMITIDDTAAESTDTSAPACANDNDCTVRIAGDYCSCPSTPRPMLASRAAAFDESLHGITNKCSCEILPCPPVLPGKSACQEGRCVLVDGGV